MWNAMHKKMRMKCVKNTNEMRKKWNWNVECDMNGMRDRMRKNSKGIFKKCN